MSAPDLSLLGKRRFAPLFVVQFLGAFNDNLLKFALLFLANFGLYAAAPEKAELLATIATGLFILPYFLLSALAGQLADKYDKAVLIRAVKAAEIGIMMLALGGFWLQSIPVLLACLFLMGVHSTLFGPVKYSILPQHLRQHEVMGGTGLIEAGTFLAILAGQLLGGVIPAWEAGLVATGVAVLGFVASLAVPSAPAAAPDLRIERNILKGTWKILTVARAGRGVWLAILGISWFFSVGAILLSEFAPLVSGTLHAGPGVVTLFLLVFSVSVAAGSLMVNRLLGGEVSARYVPGAALGMAVFLIDLWIATRGFVPVATHADVAAFLATGGSWHILIALTGIAFAGGMFIVPLYAILQVHSAAAERSRIIAANNIVNAFVTVAMVAVVTALLASGTSVPGVIGAMGFATLAIALISCWLLPETVFKALIRALLVLVYRVEVHGAEHMPKPGERAILVVNHVSFLDGLLLAAFLPGKPTFAVATRIARAWWVRPFLGMFDAFPVDPTNPMAAKAMVKAVREERTLVIFPEGRITVTGALMKVFDGPGMIADKADAPIVPVRIDGAQYTPFSRLRGKVRLRMFPKIDLTILPPRRFVVEGDTARQRRAAAGAKLYDVMSEMIFATSNTDRTLYQALIDAKDIHGARAAAVEDVKREPMRYGRLLTGSIALGRAFAPLTTRGEAVGVLLPNVNAVVATFFALQGTGRVPAMLNYTAGLTNLKAACTAAEIRSIITARAFVMQAKLGEVVAGLESAGLRVHYLEDIGAGIGALAKLHALIATRFAGRLHRRHGVSPEAPAVILFTSGSEGLPKGVVLTHRNLLSNCLQLSARIDFNSADVVLNALPVFHSFGLTGGTLLPILSGVKTLLYPSPLHYRIVPALAYDANATILFGTDTFLSGYARMAHGYDFYSLRYIFAGAERVRDETRATYAHKFGLRIMEGYGATEASPVIAVNTPMHFQAGSVGRLLPGMEARLDAVPGIADGGRLSIRGPNIMAGYLKAEAPGVLQPPEDGWHDSGDIVTIDPAGFVTIRGRAKRFAKIGGEMASLPAVEGYAAKVWPQGDHAVVTRPDARKGEQLVLFTTQHDAAAAAFQAWARANGVTELVIPRDIRVVAALPVLGTGKLDYVMMGEMAAGGR
ncbi:acyl-[ACP]--phospholipid O-acyltransferase [Sphingomonas carotinifaciens]|uniref:Acyl-[acyl-carrier-protein]-phospholipid O-acyltransferase / long-chain-fatty-acid--[acyl-carrier-protein] ligase n=1 Tax=Sphingomonas carotinifaciens TaxID=1166323 RepID=A0A1G7P9Z4_9SPHN|nr:acyl-[ACP]--phospholipid O-acyltransferase [Sphingomonas carotinifaciens]MBB4087343.1 acyl-[acyl-carrier-protein]-phospholipid O-acyltransferase/long-chain-fatty-acid--[acyl-carrier-protein] ligase [Sphingomonas carotinifaciens]SDF82419.1 acyl-[acyl-carrier-protein]-phospholipid O-acyltransferase / long-chain-fatty-acid--[acyl-carrier-protein] ligase [Sphingomonas carotinifaciens]